MIIMVIMTNREAGSPHQAVVSNMTNRNKNLAGVLQVVASKEVSVMQCCGVHVGAVSEGKEMRVAEIGVVNI